MDFELSSFDKLFMKPIKLQYVKEFDKLKIDTSHFLEWLKSEGMNITGKYAEDVNSMCEYACLYIAMMYPKRNDVRIYDGNFGFFEHFWIGIGEGEDEVFFDLTLAQFIKNAPRVAVTMPMNDRQSGYSFLTEPIGISEYLKKKKAFEFHTHPKTMQRPPKMLELQAFQDCF